MFNQLKVEWFKVRRFPLFYIVALVLAMAGFFCGFLKMSASDGAEGVFQNFVCDTSFIFIISMVSSWFIGNDFSNRTIHNEIKLGYSRLSVLITRGLMAYLISAFLHIIYIFSAIIGFSMKYGVDKNSFTVRNGLWLFTVIFQIMTIQSMIVGIVFLLKNATAAISAAVCFSFITCNVLRNFQDFYIILFNGKIFTLSAFCLAQNASLGTLIPAMIYAVVIHLAVFLFTYALFKKSEIK